VTDVLDIALCLRLENPKYFGELICLHLQVKNDESEHKLVDLDETLFFLQGPERPTVRGSSFPLST
jgi:hypothetical protein